MILFYEYVPRDTTVVTEAWFCKMAAKTSPSLNCLELFIQESVESAKSCSILYMHEADTTRPTVTEVLVVRTKLDLYCETWRNSFTLTQLKKQNYTILF